MYSDSVSQGLESSPSRDNHNILWMCTCTRARQLTFPLVSCKQLTTNISAFWQLVYSSNVKADFLMLFCIRQETHGKYGLFTNMEAMPYLTDALVCVTMGWWEAGDVCISILLTLILRQSPFQDSTYSWTHYMMLWMSLWTLVCDLVKQRNDFSRKTASNNR